MKYAGFSTRKVNLFGLKKLVMSSRNGIVTLYIDKTYGGRDRLLYKLFRQTF